MVVLGAVEVNRLSPTRAERLAPTQEVSFPPASTPSTLFCWAALAGAAEAVLLEPLEAQKRHQIVERLRHSLPTKLVQTCPLGPGRGKPPWQLSKISRPESRPARH